MNILTTKIAMILRSEGNPHHSALLLVILASLPISLSPSLFHREKARSRRVSTIGEENDSKLSIEEFHQKLTWERWSGNGHLISSESGAPPPHPPHQIISHPSRGCIASDSPQHEGFRSLKPFPCILSPQRCRRNQRRLDIQASFLAADGEA
jgi:hypothetical protein